MAVEDGNHRHEERSQGICRFARRSASPCRLRLAAAGFRRPQAAGDYPRHNGWNYEFCGHCRLVHAGNRAIAASRLARCCCRADAAIHNRNQISRDSRAGCRERDQAPAAGAGRLRRLGVSVSQFRKVLGQSRQAWCPASPSRRRRDGAFRRAVARFESKPSVRRRAKRRAGTLQARLTFDWSAQVRRQGQQEFAS
jgi:hypothetical protein